MTVQYLLPDPRLLHDDWKLNRHRDFQPNPRQRLLMDAVAKALGERLHDSEDVKDRAAQLVGFDRSKSTNVLNVHGGDFGMDVYYARQAVAAQAEYASQADAAAEMRLTIGDSLGTLVFSDYKRTTSVKLLEAVDAWTWRFEGKRGATRVTGTANALHFKNAIERACELQQRKANYAQFVESRVSLLPAA